MKYSLKVVFENKTEPTLVLDSVSFKDAIQTAIEKYPDAVGYYIQKVKD